MRSRSPTTIEVMTVKCKDCSKYSKNGYCRGFGAKVIDPEVECKCEKFKEIEIDVQTMFPIKTGLIARDTHDHVLNLAVLCNEHVLLPGPPGTGKSHLADQFFMHLEGRKFKTQLSKFSTEEALLGPLDVAALRKGEYRYAYDGSILTADYAFIDEFYDASDVTLRTLLGVLNEREFAKGSFFVKCPLKMCIATANYSRANEVVDAVVDRLLFQIDVKPLSPKEKEQLARYSPKAEPTQKISIADLLKAQESVKRVVFPDNMRAVYINLASDLGFSDRRIFKGMRVLQAQAYLSSRKDVTYGDFDVLKFLVNKAAGGVGFEEKLGKIQEYINQYGRKQEQMSGLVKVFDEWDKVPDPTGDGCTAEHIKTEMVVLRKIMDLQCSTDETEKLKDQTITEMKTHIEDTKKEFLRQQGID